MYGAEVCFGQTFPATVKSFLLKQVTLKFPMFRASLMATQCVNFLFAEYPYTSVLSTCM